MMIDREKVIKGLMCIAGDVVFCAHCKYSDVNGSGRGDRCKRDCAKDAFALLKAQEPVEPTLDIRHGKSMWRCGSCSTVLQPNQMYAKFCFNCGMAVKWE